MNNLRHIPVPSVFSQGSVREENDTLPKRALKLFSNGRFPALSLPDSHPRSCDHRVADLECFSSDCSKTQQGAKGNETQYNRTSKHAAAIATLAFWHCVLMIHWATANWAMCATTCDTRKQHACAVRPSSSSWLRKQDDGARSSFVVLQVQPTCSWPNVTSSEVNRYHSLSLLLSSPQSGLGEWRASRYVSRKSQV